MLTTTNTPSTNGDHRSTPTQPVQSHPVRPAVLDLFNLYLGRSGRNKSDDSIQEPPNKTQKRITALNLDLPPHDGQFLPDFEKLQNQFPDREQLCHAVESVLVSLVIQCSGHRPRLQFILFAVRSLYSNGYVYWDSFIPSLLSSVTSAELSVGIPSTTSPQPAVSTTSALGPNSSSIQSPNLVSPVTSALGIGSPAQAANVPSCIAISSLRKLSCQIILYALEAKLKPSTHADIFLHMLSWLVNWNHQQHGIDEVDGIQSWKRDKDLYEWLHKCLDVVKMLVDDDECRVPYYELLRSGLHFLENLPEDGKLLILIFEVHRRQDMLALYMQMLDQHLHCPTFGNQCILNQAVVNMIGESNANLSHSPVTYPSVLGEPLHGEDIAFSIQRGSLDWERALRCIKHAIRITPSPDWWRRVLMVAPCYRTHSQGSTPGAVFSSDMICEATVDRIVELLKLTNTDVNCWQEWLIFSDVLFFSDEKWLHGFC